MKDNFSKNSDQYAFYRPHYPFELFEYLDSITPFKECAWDCGTGSGQIAFELAKTFKHVIATDISQSQIENARHAENIIYSIQPAEKTNLENKQFDLIVIAQAIHWFDFDKFYQEVFRTSKDHALVCVIGYGKLIISDPIDNIISNFYSKVIGDYWDKERKYIDEEYKTIPFPFDEISTPNFEIKLNWTLEHLIGYLNTWSAVKHFIDHNGYNPIENLKTEIENHWNNSENKLVKFPLLLRLGKIKPY